MINRPDRRRTVPRRRPHQDWQSSIGAHGAPTKPLIESCEERLALSASLAGDALLELAEQTEFLVEPSHGSMDPAMADPATAQATQPQPQSLVPATDQSPLANSTSNDLFAQAENLRQSTGLTGAGQTIAVIDTGIAYDHISLGGGFGPGFRVVGGFDFAENDAIPYDDGPAGFHGTQVSSILAGQSDGFSGIAPEADLVALRVFDDQGNSDLAYVESALQYVIENQHTFESPITTVNLSVGAALSGSSQLEAISVLGDELQTLRDNNILVFAAAGNFFDSSVDPQAGASDPILFPASDPLVVAVTSISDDGDLSDFAQRQADILAAPGENIDGAVPDHVLGLDGNVDNFVRLSGTSQSTPQLAGASVLIRQSLIDQGIEPTAEAVLERLDSLTQTHIDPVTGIVFRVPNLDSLADDLGASNQADAPDLAVETVQPPLPVIDQFTGTNQTERLELDFRNGLTLRSGEQVFSVEPSVVDGTIVIDVAGGNDHLLIQGSSAAERLVLYPGDSGVSRLTTNEIEIEIRGFENVTFVGGGGPDRASLFDAPSNDTLTSQPNSASLSGVGFRFEVSEVDRIFVLATAGGSDTALLHDSVGDDQLAIRPQFTSLRGEGSFQTAFGFERVLAFSTNGGSDSIELNDSAGDDTLSISSTRTVIAGPGFSVTANGFESTIAAASNGGNDVARLFLDETTHRWRDLGDRIEWTTDDQSQGVIRGFEQVEAFENFERIELRPLSLDRLGDLDPSLPAWPDPEIEAAAARMFFETLGEPS